MPTLFDACPGKLRQKVRPLIKRDSPPVWHERGNVADGHPVEMSDVKTAVPDDGPVVRSGVF